MDLKGAEIRNFFGIILGKKDPASNERNIVSIPHYQRPYRWGSELVEQLIKDWSQQEENVNPQDRDGSQQDPSYFAGSIVTVIKTASHGYNSYELIDGQQRFTTIFLVNYVRFLLYRAMVRECCVKKNLFRGHDQYLAALIDAQSYFLKNHDSLKKYEEKINQLETDDDTDYEKYYRESAYFPLNLWDNDPEYQDEHYERLKKYLEVSGFILSYDRSFFNTVLLEVLSSVCIKISDRQEPELEIRSINDEILDGAGKNYIDAIRMIFDTFSSLVTKNNKSGFDVARELTEKTSSFLRHIQICVIETGNPDDAYTLFETLNERSLALGNLDLIKNLFFKTFVESNPSMSESDKDKNIQKLDNFWNDEIFKGTAAKAKDLITFLAIAFITGSDKITLKQSDKIVRNTLKTDHLSKFSSLEPYTFEMAQRDFNIFMACRALLDKADVKYNAVANTAFDVSYGDGSTLKKCIHFLRGANQDTVLAGLFAMTLNYIRLEEKNEKFDPSTIPSLVNKYMKQSSLPDPLKDMAFELWSISMKGKTHHPVLEYSSELLRENRLNSAKFKIVNISASGKAKLDKTFKEWLETWTYGQNYKIRMLFARCFQLNLNGGKLSNVSFKLTTDDKLDVDHMEPKKIYESNIDSYFQHSDRNSIINQLGNMMILTSSSNRQKSNQPMHTVFDNLNAIGLSGHFITIKTDELLEMHHRLTSNKIRVPTEQFFNERKKFLIDTFSEAVDIPF